MATEPGAAAAGAGGAPRVEQVIRENMGLVRQVAQRFHLGSASPVEMNDLLQLGILGLIDATEKFDETKGTSFQSYARFRIRGSILDGLRHLDFVPRSVRRKRREVLEATHRVEQERGGQADDDEIAEALDMDPAEFQELLGQVMGVTLTSVEDLQDRGGEAELSEALATFAAAMGPAEHLERVETRRLIADAIRALPEKEGVVLSLYYYEDLTMREVGDVLGVTESRVSQLHAKALARLRLRLAEEMRPALA